MLWWLVVLDESFKHICSVEQKVAAVWALHWREDILRYIITAGAMGLCQRRLSLHVTRGVLHLVRGDHIPSSNRPQDFHDNADLIPDVVNHQAAVRPKLFDSYSGHRMQLMKAQEFPEYLRHICLLVVYVPIQFKTAGGSKCQTRAHQSDLVLLKFRNKVQRLPPSHLAAKTSAGS